MGYNPRKNQRYRWGKMWRQRGYVKKGLVEDCCGVLDAFPLAGDAFIPGPRPMLQPVTEAVLGTVEPLRQIGATALAVRVRPLDGPASDLTLSLYPVRQHFGGHCWYFACPSCSRRVRKLYQPTPADGFACRDCHRLTYRTQQRHKCRDYIQSVTGGGDVLTTWQRMNETLRQAGCSPLPIPYHVRRAALHGR